MVVELVSVDNLVFFVLMWDWVLKWWWFKLVMCDGVLVVVWIIRMVCFEIVLFG